MITVQSSGAQRIFDYPVLHIFLGKGLESFLHLRLIQTSLKLTVSTLPHCSVASVASQSGMHLYFVTLY